MYAGRKRRKPVQRAAKQLPSDGVKSNPSKRHRDRLNGELDRLASLLPFPEEVTTSLDKLSILRLSVSYLRAKNFFSEALKNHVSKSVTGSGSSSSNHENNKPTGLSDSWMAEGELLLQALNGFVLVTTSEGIIFYASHTIQDYLGFHQTDVMHQSVFELIHTEDQQEYRRNLHWALNPPAAAPQTDDSPPDGEQPVSSVSLVTYNPEQLPPENSSFLERSFVCRFRCLLDNSSGFLALNLQGRLKFLHGQNHRLDDGCQVPPQLALFTIATPLQPPAILEIRTKNMIFRTKHKLDFTPMACDAKGKIVLGYTEAELRVRGSGYQFIHAADMLHCAENHVRMIKTGESGLTVFRLLTKDNRWKWVQANARLVYKNGKPDYIIATQRPLVDEEGGEHLRKRSMHLPFTFATGEALLYQTSYPMHGFPDGVGGGSGSGAHTKAKNSKAKKAKSDSKSSSSKDELDPSSLLGALMSQDGSVYVCQPASEPKMPPLRSLFGESDNGCCGAGSSDGGHGHGHGSGSGLGSVAVPSNGWGVPAPNGFVPSALSDRFGERSSSSSKGEPSSFDPLLATLDSLTLESEENCSNSELFSALENLGLNAEDLELLLLDERMIRVEMEPDYVPSLNDLLTNNEILSYIHDSLENDSGLPVTSSGNNNTSIISSSSSSSSSSNSASSSSVTGSSSLRADPPSTTTTTVSPPHLTLPPATFTQTQTQYTPVTEPEPCPVPSHTQNSILPNVYQQYHPHKKPPTALPIVQLSQQMHQHLNVHAGPNGPQQQTWGMQGGVPLNGPTAPRVPLTQQHDPHHMHIDSVAPGTAIPNGHWVPQRASTTGMQDHCHLQHPLHQGNKATHNAMTTTTTASASTAGIHSSWQQNQQLLQPQMVQGQCHFKPGLETHGLAGNTMPTPAATTSFPSSSSSSSSSSSMNGVYPPMGTNLHDWDGFNCTTNQLGLVASSNTPFFPNGHAPPPSTHTQTTAGLVVGGTAPHMDYNMGHPLGGAGAGYHLNNVVAVAGSGQCQPQLMTQPAAAVAAGFPLGLQKQDIRNRPPPQHPKAGLGPVPVPGPVPGAVPPSSNCCPQHPQHHQHHQGPAQQHQTSPLDHLLGLGQNQHQHLPHLEDYGLISSTGDPDTVPCSKMESVCVLNSTSVAYTTGRLVPNGNATTPGDNLLPHPEGLPNLADPQSSGFYL
ncbi:aryl hydrocarbon receptor 1b [Engraulis encrasicolus]